ncbi:MAG: hypothetical protein DYG98_07295 [Haliscomenobacteraceae bacterium CHB4]|nr:hypothetical protein [Haliscomenobacteraceae bacterium CHB4]
MCFRLSDFGHICAVVDDVLFLPRKTLTMRKTFVFLLFAFGLARCGDAPKPGTSQLSASQPSVPATLRGYYILGNEVNMLRNCADNKQYWVVDATGTLDSLYSEACFPAPIPYEAVYAVLTGTLGPRDSPGYASEADGTFTVRRVDTLQAKTMFNACMPYEFWCHGTEPFWGLEISEAEGGIFFKNIAHERGAQYAWTEPVTDGKTSWVYETYNDEESLKIAIKKEKCSDGMSDIEYGYSVQVTIGEEILRGCSVRGGERIPGPTY